MCKRILSVAVIVFILGTSFVYADGPKGLISIPELDFKKEIWFAPLDTAGWNSVYWDDNKIAHLGNTAWIDADSFNVILVGHVNQDFGIVLDLKVGDSIYVYDGKYEVRYDVISVESVHQSEVSVLDSTFIPMLVLVTCNPENYNYRIIIKAIKIYERVQFDGTITYPNSVG